MHGCLASALVKARRASHEVCRCLLHAISPPTAGVWPAHAGGIVNIILDGKGLGWGQNDGPTLGVCLTGGQRISKREVWDFCEEYFKKYNYEVKYLKKCGIEIREGKAPKELKPKNRRRLLRLA